MILPPADCHDWPAVWSLLPPEWHTDAVLGIARAAVAEGDYSRLPVLADALEVVGCDRTDVLAHFRRPGPHEAGCWALQQVVLTNRLFVTIPPLPLTIPVMPVFGPLPGLICSTDPKMRTPSRLGKMTAFCITVGVIMFWLLGRYIR